MTLRAYARIFRERWKTVAFVVLLCIGLAVLITALTPKTYQASAQIFVTSNGVTTGATQYDQQATVLSQVTTFADLIDTPDVIHGVQRDLNLAMSDSELRSRLTASAPAQQTLLIVQATDGSPGTAAALANSAARIFSGVIENLNKPTDSSKSTVRLFVTNQATAPATAVSPKPTLNIAVGILLGILLGAALAVGRDLLDNRVKDLSELARIGETAAMGAVVDDSATSRYPIATRAGTRNVRAENFRQLRANLQFANVDEHPRVIAITSSVPNEGKTMIAMNLASTLAEAGFTVCLVDADLRRPTVARTLGLANPVGLTSVLVQQIALSDALQNAGPNLFVLASGPTPPNPSEVLASSYVRDVIRSLLDTMDYVVIDTAPLLPVADGSEVAALADGTLLVARHKATTEQQVKRAIGTLARVDAKLLGVVLNRVPNKRTGEYGYAYYRADEAELGTANSRSGRSLVGRKAREDVAR